SGSRATVTTDEPVGASSSSVPTLSGPSAVESTVAPPASAPVTGGASAVRTPPAEPAPTAKPGPAPDYDELSPTNPDPGSRRGRPARVPRRSSRDPIPAPRHPPGTVPLLTPRGQPPPLRRLSAARAWETSSSPSSLDLPRVMCSTRIRPTARGGTSSSTTAP